MDNDRDDINSLLSPRKKSIDNSGIILSSFSD